MELEDLKRLEDLRDIQQSISVERRLSGWRLR
jgi:hypothetical protein